MLFGVVVHAMFVSVALAPAALKSIGMQALRSSVTTRLTTPPSVHVSVSLRFRLSRLPRRPERLQPFTVGAVVTWICGVTVRWTCVFETVLPVVPLVELSFVSVVWRVAVFGKIKSSALQLK
jgi:hypothetical protein